MGIDLNNNNVLTRLKSPLHHLRIRLRNVRLHWQGGASAEFGSEIEDSAFVGGDVRVVRTPFEIVSLDVPFDDLGDDVVFQRTAHGEGVVEGFGVAPLWRGSGCGEGYCAEDGGEEDRELHLEMVGGIFAVMLEVEGSLQPPVLLLILWQAFARYLY